MISGASQPVTPVPVMIPVACRAVAGSAPQPGTSPASITDRARVLARYGPVPLPAGARRKAQDAECQHYTV